MKMSRILTRLGLVASMVALCALAIAAATNYSLFGDSMLVSPGNASATAAQIRSDCAIAPNYGGVDITVPAGLTVAGLNKLATDYKFTQGTDGGGSPRFGVTVTTPTGGSPTIFFYLGPPPNYTGDPPNVWLNTGNLAAPTNLVDTSQLPGGNFYDPYAHAQALYGSYPVTDIFIVVDACWFAGTQTVWVDNVMVNNTTVTFEKPVAQTKDQCKNGGWQTVTRADGSTFKNQGDCIQYVNTGK